MRDVAAQNHLPRRLGRRLLSRVARQVAIVGVVCLLGGCFDANNMIASRRELAKLARMEEIDLGAFRVSLPQMPNATSSAVVDFHAFGQVVNSKARAVSKAVEQHGPELRYRMLLAVRELNLTELEEPSLDTLRKNIEQVVNDTLPGDSIQSIGLYRFSLTSQ